LIYYPDSVVDPVSMMEFLQKQARAHEEKQALLEQHKLGAANMMSYAGTMNTNKKKKRNRAPKYVKEIQHINEDSNLREVSYRPVDFDNLLHETKQTEHASFQLHNIRR